MSKLVRIVPQSDRYVMPVMQTRGEGRGNGVKTVIENMLDLSKHLRREPEHITRYFGFELGAMARYDKTTGFATLNGTHTLRDLNEHLQTFITRYLVCPNCGLPELEFKFPKPGVCVADCAGCGHNEPLDGTHRLSVIIARGGGAKSRAPGQRRSKRQQPMNPVKRIAARLNTLDKEIEDDRLSPEAAADRRVEGVRALLAALVEEGILQLDEDVAALVAAACDQDVLERWKDVAPLLKAVAGRDQLKQMYVLYSVEMLVKRAPAALAALNNIFFNLYMSEVVGEPVFFDWASPGAEPFVPAPEHARNIAAVAPFLTWLHEADEANEASATGDDDYSYDESYSEDE
eukprot:gnl/Chilomastix_cuspidata/1171.p1 GENE.gnl/Chilomastix_cuspidata/1171~~gnl/Chilomastix_cuspidata/1171.p1  ORF type:complete len:346 (-),score=190.86 gnl/Chilomastix_cuspidata/1171:278-1315(-)